MSRQSKIFEALSTDPVLASMGVELVKRTAGEENPPEVCFVVLTWLDSSLQVPGADTQILQVYVYDTLGSYKRIDDILAYLRGYLGTALIDPQSHWDGDSGDLYDSSWNRAMRYGSYTVA